MPSPLSDVTKPMPCSAEAEQALLACGLQHPDMSIGILTQRGCCKEWFHFANHRVLWETVQTMHFEAKGIDLTTVISRLMDAKALEDVGGAAEVATLFQLSVLPGHLAHYVEIVREKWIRRTIIEAAMGLISDCFEETEKPVLELLGKAEETVYSLSLKESKGEDVQPMKRYVLEAMDHIELIHKHRGQVTDGLATGFTDVDRMLMGIKPRNMVVIGARPSVGKTALMQCLAENVGLGVGHYQDWRQKAVPTLLISMEMAGIELTERMILSRAGANLMRLRDGFLSKGQMQALGRVGTEFSRAPLWIWDASSLTIQEIKARVRQLVKSDKIGLVCLDYLQLVKSASKNAKASREREVAEVAEGLKQIARENEIAVVALAQLNRDVEQRGKNAKPSMADLRESGQIEQAADVVGLLYRPSRGTGSTPVPPSEAFREKHEDLDEDDLWKAWNEQASLIIGKHRNGPVGEVALKWTGELTRFESRTDRLFSNNTEQHQQS